MPGPRVFGAVIEAQEPGRLIGLEIVNERVNATQHQIWPTTAGRVLNGVHSIGVMKHADQTRDPALLRANVNLKGIAWRVYQQRPALTNRRQYRFQALKFGGVQELRLQIMIPDRLKIDLGSLDGLAWLLNLYYGHAVTSLDLQRIGTVPFTRI
jgi:hypothetical protein